MTGQRDAGAWAEEELRVQPGLQDHFRIEHVLAGLSLGSISASIDMLILNHNAAIWWQPKTENPIMRSILI